MEVTVYIDVLFALNFLMNLVLLFLTALAVRIPVSLARITASATLLAVYGVLVVFPELSPVFSFVGKVGITVPAILILCSKEQRRLQLKTLGVFWLISVAIGGIIFALSIPKETALLVNGSLYLDLSLTTIMLGIGAVYLLILGFCRLSEQRCSQRRMLFPFCLTAGEKEIYFTALLDTGCELTVPVLGDAVMLIAKELLEQTPKETFGIPIQTATGQKEIPAFYPEKLVCLNHRCRIQGIPAIGITEKAFSKESQYQAVFNPAMLQVGGKSDETSKNSVSNLVAKAAAAVRITKRQTGTLHRRKRDAATALEPSGGEPVARTTESSGAAASGAANLD